MAKSRSSVRGEKGRGSAGPYERTLAEAAKQKQTVTSEGVSVAPPLDGVIRNSVTSHVDERGFLV